jgi:dipeptide/tripeptide permease
VDLAERLTAMRSGFSRTFWVANVIELFERLAFYGSKAILTVYLAETLGLGTFGNSLVGIYGFAIFFLPIVAGVFVDRYGFKKSLLACFTIFGLGYFAVGLAAMPAGQGLVALVGMKAYAIAALMLTAIGGSLIKPCIVGTVAQTTTDETKSLGYSIYYSLVNLGGFLGPLLALPVRQGLGIQYVLVMAALFSALNLLGTLLFYKDPPIEGGPRRTLGKVVKDMLMVFTNLRFISFLVIFSGFWVVFWQIFYSLPFFVRDVLHYEKFELIETVDALAIIILTVAVTALMQRVRPILAMSSGFALASLSWLLIVAHPTLTMTVVAIVIFAVGEMMQAPRFYEYVADLAPKDQIGTFMGFAFLPVAIGAILAGFLSGWLVEHYLKGAHPHPERMWLVVSAIGVASTVLMLLYDRFVAPRKAVTA